MDIKLLKPLTELSEFDQNVIKAIHFIEKHLENIEEIKGFALKATSFYLSTEETIELRILEMIYFKNPHEQLDFNDFVFSPQGHKLKDNNLGIASTKEIFKDLESFNENNKMKKIVATYPENKLLHHCGHEELYVSKDNYITDIGNVLQRVCPHLEIELEKIKIMKNMDKSPIQPISKPKTKI